MTEAERQSYMDEFEELKVWRKKRRRGFVVVCVFGFVIGGLCLGCGVYLLNLDKIGRAVVMFVLAAIDFSLAINDIAWLDKDTRRWAYLERAHNLLVKDNEATKE